MALALAHPHALACPPLFLPDAAAKPSPRFIFMRLVLSRLASAAGTGRSSQPLLAAFVVAVLLRLGRRRLALAPTAGYTTRREGAPFPNEPVAERPLMQSQAGGVILQ